MTIQALDCELEQSLVCSAHQDAQAFMRLYHHYLPRLYAYVAYRVGRRQDAEDLVAETFMRMFEGLGDFRWQGEGSFAAWLLRIAHNLVQDLRRRQGRRAEVLGLEELPEIRDDAALPDEALERKAEFARLQRLITGLPARQREVITLRFFGGLRNREIAQALGLDPRTVASHLCRGVETLHRKYCAEKGTNPCAH